MNLSSIYHSLDHLSSGVSNRFESMICKNLELKNTDSPLKPCFDRSLNFLEVLAMPFLTPFLGAYHSAEALNSAFYALKHPSKKNFHYLARASFFPFYDIVKMCLYDTPKDVLKTPVHDFIAEVLYVRSQNISLNPDPSKTKKTSIVLSKPNLSKLQKVYYTSLAAISPLLLPIAPLGLLVTPYWASLDQKLWKHPPMSYASLPESAGEDTL